MAEAGLPAPEYRQNDFMVYATIRQAKDAAEQVAGNGDVNGDVNGDDRVYFRIDRKEYPYNR